MARNRTPQTFEKRRREHDKQKKRLAKIAQRQERNAARRQARQDADNGIVAPEQPAAPDPTPAPGSDAGQ